MLPSVCTSEHSLCLTYRNRVEVIDGRENERGRECSGKLPIQTGLRLIKSQPGILDQKETQYLLEDFHRDTSRLMKCSKTRESSYSSDLLKRNTIRKQHKGFLQKNRQGLVVFWENGYWWSLMRCPHLTRLSGVLTKQSTFQRIPVPPVPARSHISETTEDLVFLVFLGIQLGMIILQK